MLFFSHLTNMFLPELFYTTIAIFSTKNSENSTAGENIPNSHLKYLIVCAILSKKLLSLIDLTMKKGIIIGNTKKVQILRVRQVYYKSWKMKFPEKK